ncbi:MAG: hypothetical protein M3Y75_06890 [Actinomycetota bacterium]|nr:hypothetical protein [Actinomycetota bacterium]
MLEPGGNPNDFHVVAQSSVIAASAGQNVVESRLPVKPGHRFGLYSQDGQTPYCRTAFAQDVLGYALGDAQVTSTYSFAMESQAQVPIAARIEPDADNDGFGDETQDKCPQSPTTQGACPAPVTPVAFSTFTQVKKGSVTVVVTPSASSSVTVKGVVKLGKGRKATLNGGTQILSPGLQGRFKLFFIKKVKDKLKELSRKQSLKLNVTVSGANATGVMTTKALKLKIKGQAKP